MITKYEAGGYPLIKRKEFVRETDKFLVRSNGFRDAKETSYSAYFDTLEQAKAFLVSRCKSKIQQYEQSIQTLKADISACETIKEEDVK
jgi:hypothetical protein